MPQPRNRRTSTTAKAKPAAAKPARAAAKPARAAAKPARAAAKPAAATSKRAAAAKPAAASKPASSASTASASSTKTKPKPSAPDARLEAAANRLRKLNERIIEAGKEAGESTLSSYEKALKAIATSIESGPGKSEIEWISHLATTQAKFLRDVTNAWTAAARGVLK